MNTATLYAEFADHLRGLGALDQVAGLLNWDQETQMPPKGSAQRAEQCAAVARAAHALATAPRLAELVGLLEGADLDPAQAVNVAEAGRISRRATRVPAELAAELARASALAQTVWQTARESNSFADFAPVLERVVSLKREQARCLVEGSETPYEALLAEYEPGMTEAELSGMFGRMRPKLTLLAERIAGSGWRMPRFTGAFARAGQLALSRRLCDVFGFDGQAGRLDLAVHPSSSGSGGDVRITTRVNEYDPRECAYATIHELGHAVYEQGLDPAQALLPVGMSASMAVHESQSRLFENQLGRGRAFCEWLCPAFGAQFGATGVDMPETFYAAVNLVEPGFIRTEADEVHYNLHIMLRYDLERELIAGTLDVADLEAAWNARFLADFGVEVPEPRLGALQDVHWSAGLFGYFPTYALGNVYAAELNVALRAALPGLDRMLASGDVWPVVEWLRANIHRKGRLLPPAKLIAEACGRAPSEAALLDYLGRKYGALYTL
ncbi:carboxypeptidase M32 [Amaricoccus solimangrovi]|uniref:Metal-dependent carboxypeptidase n=1 Tax=Amaricoccus solimangrovi TaxID=2589815 RepID=A0A501X114_9RHOB|nr:carboxypeptidase M32 [Amaricoccus solimangrovi]TPE52986.1 carboxypeptidase M32 [Amaricoccus solimangrovi]